MLFTVTIILISYVCIFSKCPALVGGATDVTDLNKSVRTIAGSRDNMKIGLTR